MDFSFSAFMDHSFAGLIVADSAHFDVGDGMDEIKAYLGRARVHLSFIWGDENCR